MPLSNKLKASLEKLHSPSLAAAVVSAIATPATLSTDMRQRIRHMVANVAVGNEVVNSMQAASKALASVDQRALAMALNSWDDAAELIAALKAR